MPDQLRYNGGKVRLSYVYANHRALNDIDFDGEPTYKAAIAMVIAYTAGGPRKLLARAVGSWIAAMDGDLTGDPWAHEVGVVSGTLLSFPEVMRALADVYAYGASKYQDGNFRKGAPVRQYLDSFFRHAQEMDINGTLVPDDDAAEIGFYVLHSGQALWNLITSLDQPDMRDDRLPAVQFGEFDNNPQHAIQEVDLVLPEDAVVPSDAEEVPPFDAYEEAGAFEDLVGFEIQTRQNPEEFGGRMFNNDEEPTVAWFGTNHNDYDYDVVFEFEVSSGTEVLALNASYSSRGERLPDTNFPCDCEMCSYSSAAFEGL